MDRVPPPSRPRTMLYCTGRFLPRALSVWTRAGAGVGWSDILRQRQQRIKATPTGVAAYIAEAIVDSTNLLRTRLEEEGLRWADPGRFDSDECLLECTLFEWFLRDIVVSAEFGRQAEAIRRALAGRVLIDLQRCGLSQTCLADFDRRQQARLDEYHEALKAGSSLQAFGAVAWLRISGSSEPCERMTMLLAVRATAELRALHGFAKGYTLVELPPVLRS